MHAWLLHLVHVYLLVQVINEEKSFIPVHINVTKKSLQAILHQAAIHHLGIMHYYNRFVITISLITYDTNVAEDIFYTIVKPTKCWRR